MPFGVPVLLGLRSYSGIGQKKKQIFEGTWGKLFCQRRNKQEKYAEFNSKIRF